MTSAELRRIVGAMTAAPWHKFKSPLADALGVQHEGALYHGDAYVADCIGSVNEHADVEAIATLANHADALVALVEAVERHRDRLEHTLAGAIGDKQAGEIRALLAALAAVHAIKGTP